MCVDAIDITRVWESLAKLNSGEKISKEEFDHIVRSGYPIKLVKPNIEEYVSH